MEILSNVLILKQFFVEYSKTGDKQSQKFHITAEAVLERCHKRVSDGWGLVRNYEKLNVRPQIFHRKNTLPQLHEGEVSLSLIMIICHLHIKRDHPDVDLHLVLSHLLNVVWINVIKKREKRGTFLDGLECSPCLGFIVFCRPAFMFLCYPIHVDICFITCNKTFVWHGIF